MSLPVLFFLIFILICAFILRLSILIAHLNRLDTLWYDFDRRGLRYRLAQLLDLLTFVGYAICAGYVLWTLPGSEASGAGRYITVFVAWFGVALLERLAVHRFPPTNAPALFNDAYVSLLTNLLLALLSGMMMTGATALYFWLRA